VPSKPFDKTVKLKCGATVRLYQERVLFTADVCQSGYGGGIIKVDGGGWAHGGSICFRKDVIPYLIKLLRAAYRAK